MERVELCCHTGMSDDNSVASPKNLIQRAIDLGMKAIAITDLDSVQAFPDACHYTEYLNEEHAKKLREAGLPEEEPLKLIYGAELRVVDDEFSATENDKGQSLSDTFVAVDCETTGFSPAFDRLIEIGAVRFEDGIPEERFSTYINPGIAIPEEITNLTDIDDLTVSGAPTIDEVLPKFFEFCGESMIVGHNLPFDLSFIKAEAKRLGIDFEPTSIDTLPLSRLVLNLGSYRLNTVANALGLSAEKPECAADDAELAGFIYTSLIDKLKEQGINTLTELDENGIYSSKAVTGLKSEPVIVLAKNDTGLHNLYKLITLSHTTFCDGWRKVVPLSVLKEYRGDLIIGTSPGRMEVLEAIGARQSEEMINSTAGFYDFLTIEPPCNLDYLTDWFRCPEINNMEDIKECIGKYVKTGETLGIPVVASARVKYACAEDDIAHRILADHSGWCDCDRDRADNHLMSAEEMMAEFEFLGEETARKIVVDNTNLIADMIGEVSPQKKGKQYPVYPDAEDKLREICEARAHEIYGDKLPDEVSDRLEKELSRITENGFASLYMYAYLLVKKSHEDGFPTQLRGSGGGSFVVYLAGITDVNPLEPHYLCDKCHYAEFDLSGIESMYPGAMAPDLPDKKCPVCGEELRKEGFNIPVETFLGFHGDREPDFDINFAVQYRFKAVEYLKGLPGIGELYIPGTYVYMSEVEAEKAVRDYCDKHHMELPEEETGRITKMLSSVRKRDGMHPGGVIAVPEGVDVEYYTPIEAERGTHTTHLEYYSIDNCLLKIDLLMHKALDMLQMLEQETGVNPSDIPLEDEKMMSLFYSAEALGIDREGITDGLAGLPEFGAMRGDWAKIGQPKRFSDIAKIDALCHDSFDQEGNVEGILSKFGSLSECIATRDDVMHYLLDKGLSREDAFKIMEWVRKGKACRHSRFGFKPEMLQEMTDHGVPEEYIDACKDIMYLFPKAHTVQYTFLAWRILYYKLYYPEAFYKAYVRHYANMDKLPFLNGVEQAEGYYKYLMKMKQAGHLNSVQRTLFRDSKVALEMYARGITPDKSWEKK
ncbi:DNA polymerase-3 subunit alpha [Lachnospiraceae bacterium XBB2008]|nr:DNA polymerase-3 subunit alpha [Lachnospiraceae bacterium XBB2008]